MFIFVNNDSSDEERAGFFEKISFLFALYFCTILDSCNGSCCTVVGLLKFWLRPFWLKRRVD
jgi:hypothetical protein